MSRNQRDKQIPPPEFNSWDEVWAEHQLRGKMLAELRTQLATANARIYRLRAECLAWRAWKDRGADKDTHPDTRVGSLLADVLRARLTCDTHHDLNTGGASDAG